MELNSIAELLGRGLIYWGLKKKLEETPILPFVGGWFECKATALSLCFFLISIHFISKKIVAVKEKQQCSLFDKVCKISHWPLNQLQIFLYFFFLYLDWTNKMKKQESNKKKSRLRGADSYSIPKPHTRCPDKTPRAWYMQMTLRINIPNFYEAIRQN